MAKKISVYFWSLFIILKGVCLTLLSILSLVERHSILWLFNPWHFYSILFILGLFMKVPEQCWVENFGVEVSWIFLFHVIIWFLVFPIPKTDKFFFLNFKFYLQLVSIGHSWNYAVSISILQWIIFQCVDTVNYRFNPSNTDTDIFYKSYTDINIDA